MNLSDLLRERGVDPEDFLFRAALDRSVISPHYMRMGLIASYVGLAFDWTASFEGWDFWSDMSERWRSEKVRSRWPELERAMGLLDPLEAELLEVEDAST